MRAKRSVKRTKTHNSPQEENVLPIDLAAVRKLPAARILDGILFTTRGTKHNIHHKKKASYPLTLQRCAPSGQALEDFALRSARCKIEA
jgi:hypothetical protein